MNNETRINNILSNHPEFKPVESEIKRLVEWNWLDDEIIRFCKLTEEVACRRMNSIVNEVKDRLTKAGKPTYMFCKKDK